MDHVKWMNSFPVGTKLVRKKTPDSYWKKMENGAWKSSVTGDSYMPSIFHESIKDSTLWAVELPIKKVYVNETEY